MGLSVNEICKRLNITISNYKALLQKYDIKTKQREYIERNLEASVNEIIALKNAGKNATQICKELKINRATYNRLIKQYQDLI